MTAKILVVEDRESDAVMLRSLLVDEGFQVRVAPDGLTALQTARDWVPELVLLDLGLPDINGFEVCRRLRQMNRVASVPVIIVTARTGMEAVREAFQAGANDFITKPFDIDDLLAQTAAVLTLSKKARRKGATNRALLVTIGLLSIVALVFWLFQLLLR